MSVIKPFLKSKSDMCFGFKLQIKRYTYLLVIVIVNIWYGCLSGLATGFLRNAPRVRSWQGARIELAAPTDGRALQMVVPGLRVLRTWIFLNCPYNEHEHE